MESNSFKLFCALRKLYAELLLQSSHALKCYGNFINGIVLIQVVDQDHHNHIHILKNIMVLEMHISLMLFLHCHLLELLSSVNALVLLVIPDNTVLNFPLLVKY